MRFLLLAAAVTLVRDPTGKSAGDPLQPWFDSLRNKVGLFCCANADGYPRCSAANVRFRSHVASRPWATAKGG
jgi:hypothetical protein